MTAKPVKTRSQKVAGDIEALLRARNPLLWVVTREEARVEQYLIEAAVTAKYVPYTWDTAAGVLRFSGEKADFGSPDIGETLAVIAQRASPNADAERAVWILRDAPIWLEGFPGAAPQRALRNLVRKLRDSTPRDRAQAIIILTPSRKIPDELAGHTTVIDWPLPDRAEIAAILDAAIDVVKDVIPNAAPNGTREAAIDAAIGLSGEEAKSTYGKSLVRLRRIDPVLIGSEKKAVIARERVLEWYDPIPGGISAVGGLEPLKQWLAARKLAYTPEARAYGLPSPKGVLFVGPPGTGKSLTAKAIATAWGVPLLKVDLGALKSKFVGESEGNLRKAFAVIETVGRCVVWFDEIEKSLAGATQGAADGGVSSDALGAILNWMQERRGEAFVVATANDAASLPPELLRKGRFDEVFFLDLPNRGERAQILQTALQSNGRGAVVIDNAKLAQVTDGWTGSEIAAIVPDAMFAAFADGAREIATADLVEAAKSVVPLSKTAAEKITRLREWAAGRARPANTPYVADTVGTGLAVELDI